MPLLSDPGPADRGKYFFSCSTNYQEAAAYQVIDIASASKLIDAGQVKFAFSGWLGGTADSPDNASLHLVFYDAAGAAVAPGTDFDPVTQAERGSRTGLWVRSASGTVPAGARRARVTLKFHRYQPIENNDAFADRISLILTNSVRPSIGGIVGLGDFGALPDISPVP